MKRSALSRPEVLVIVLAAALIGLAGTLAVNAYLTRDHAWFQVVSPSGEKAVQILAMNRLMRVYVKTDQDNFYLCGGRTWRDTCQLVRAADVPVVKTPGRWSNCSGPFPETPPLPGAAVDSLEAGQCFEGRTYTRIVILSDGTMWQWVRTYSWVNGFALATGAGISLVLGVLTGWLAVWLRRYLSDPVVAPGPRPRTE